MALNIKNDEADQLARKLAQKTGESITEAVIVALRERLSREEARTPHFPLADELARIRNRCARLPVLNEGTPEDVIGYDESGLPV